MTTALMDVVVNWNENTSRHMDLKIQTQKYITHVMFC